VGGYNIPDTIAKQAVRVGNENKQLSNNVLGGISEVPRSTAGGKKKRSSMR